MKKVSVLLLFVAILLSSCSEDLTDLAALEVEKSQITVSEKGEEVRMEITTNQKVWNAFSKSEWIELVPSGTTLVIRAEQNPLPSPREATIVVSAGGNTKEVKVYQARMEVVITTASNRIETTQWGGVYTFDINTNIREWKIENDLDWVKVTKDKVSDQAIIEVTENHGREMRAGKIFFSGPDNQGATEIEIVQEGIIYYILPFWELGAKSDKIVKFEEARRSKLYVQPNGKDNYTIWGFTTASPVYSKIFYNVDLHKGLIQAQIHAISKQEWDKNIAGYKSMLLENGYTQTEDPDKYVNVEKSIEAGFYEQGGEFFIDFIFVPMQKTPLPTWSTLPLGLTEFGVADKERVLAYEKNEAPERGTFNENVSQNLSDGKTQFLFFNVKSSATKQLARYYFVEKPGDGSKKLVQSAANYSDINLWKYQADDGNLYHTKEFQALMLKSNFAYATTWQGMDVYVNSGEGLQLMIGWVESYDPEYTGNVLEVRLSRYGAAGGAANAKPVTNQSRKIVSLNR